MFDCANVEMRELLPELVAGTLDARTRARVEEHVAGCAECASELETLRLVRGAFEPAPAIDTGRIVAALPKPPVATPTPRTTTLGRRWMDWRVAAALTMITIGGLSVVVSRRPGADVPAPIDSALSTDLASARRDSGPRLVAVAPPERAGDTGLPKAQPTRPVAAEKPQLSFGGGVSDLDDASIQALLGALDEIDRQPIAVSAEPDHSPVLPVIREGTR